jgi:hypothetical protein
MADVITSDRQRHEFALQFTSKGIEFTHARTQALSSVTRADIDIASGDRMTWKEEGRCMSMNRIETGRNWRISIVAMNVQRRGEAPQPKINE